MHSPDSINSERKHDESSKIETINSMQIRNTSSLSSNSESLADIPENHPKNDLNEDYRQVTLAWKELSVYVRLRKVGFFQHRPRHRPIKRVINNLSGIVTPGNLLAIMGASGSGKTTLMNVLAHKLTSDVCLDGEILVNGTRCGKNIAMISGYMYQDDLFIESLTVSEHLHFMARMKLDSRLRKWERERRVEVLLSDLGLLKSTETKIGSLSGGERKRLAFATEVLTDPPILFCDEPTTGLDSFSAQKIVGIMRDMAGQGKTVLCTIHQPSSQVFSMFDQLLLIAEGRTAYMGRREEAPEFFANLGYVCPEHFNPADFYIKTLALYHQTSSSRVEAQKVVKHICDSYAISPAAELLQQNLQLEFKTLDTNNFFTTSTMSSVETISEISNLGRPGWFTKTIWLTWRAFLDSVRNPSIHFVRIIQKIVLALLIGLCFFEIGFNKTQVGIQGIQGAIYLFLTESTYPIMYGIVHVFPLEMPLFLREKKGGLYRVDSYYLAKTISLLPGFILDPIIFVLIAYWLVGFQPTIDAFLYTALIVVMTSNAAAACGCFFSTATDNITSAFTLLIPVDYILFIAAGLLINLDSLPPYISWIRYVSWFMYSNEAISITQWNTVTDIECSDTLVTSPCIKSGEGVLESFSFSSTNFLLDLIGLTTLILFFHLAAFIALVIKTRRK